jgi:hypothetical protein
MAIAWQIRLMEADGDLAAILDDYEGFSFTRRVNHPGAYALRMNGLSPNCALFELDGQVEFWWRDIDNGIAWRNEFGALHRSGIYYVTDDDRIKFQTEGRGYIDLLARRVVEDKTASAGASKDGVAETVLKAYVTEQCDTGGRALANFSVEADGAGGNNVTLSKAYRNVLEIAQEIARVGGGDFDVVRTGAATFEFRWYDGQLGTDRSASVVFALERGNMARPELWQSRTSEVTAVLVGGQGEEAGRATTWRTDAVRIAQSPWNRIEAFIDARNEPDSDGLDMRGDVRLEEGRPRTTLSFDVVQVPGCLYGSDYFLGDLVTAQFMGLETTKKILAATFTVDAAGTKVAVEMADV